MLYELNRLSEAVAKGCDAIAVRRKVFSREAEDVGSLLYAVGIMLYALLRKREALDFEKEAYYIRKKCLGAEHDDTKEALFYIQQIHEDLNLGEFVT